MLARWMPALEIRLDAWHWMRRIASCVTTESHQLYGDFMGRLARCMFEYNTDDLKALKAAVRSTMLAEHIGSRTWQDT